MKGDPSNGSRSNGRAAPRDPEIQFPPVTQADILRALGLPEDALLPPGYEAYVTPCAGFRVP